MEEKETEQETEAQGVTSRKKFRSFFEWIETFAVYFAIGIVLLTVFFRHSPVVGSSMYPTLKENDIVIVRQIFYSPKAGDIIVCQSETYGLEKPLVKRIIATEGQTVSIDYQSWTVSVDGVILDEQYVNFQEDEPMRGSDHLEDTFTVPKGMLFVMGDNRNGSSDSRSSSIGFIDERLVIGKVAFRLIPFSEFKFF